jgi:hypothetical protein
MGAEAGAGDKVLRLATSEQASCAFRSDALASSSLCLCSSGWSRLKKLWKSCPGDCGCRKNRWANIKLFWQFGDTSSRNTKRIFRKLPTLVELRSCSKRLLASCIGVGSFALSLALPKDPHFWELRRDFPLAGLGILNELCRDALITLSGEEYADPDPWAREEREEEEEGGEVRVPLLLDCCGDIPFFCEILWSLALPDCCCGDISLPSSRSGMAPPPPSSSMNASKGMECPPAFACPDVDPMVDPVDIPSPPLLSTLCGLLLLWLLNEFLVDGPPAWLLDFRDAGDCDGSVVLKLFALPFALFALFVALAFAAVIISCCSACFNRFTVSHSTFLRWRRLIDSCSAFDRLARLLEYLLENLLACEALELVLEAPKASP